MPENVLLYVMREYGLVGLFLVVGAAMVSAAWAQIVQLKRWQPQTQKLIDQMGTLIAAAQLQHSQCLLHYQTAQRLTDDMRVLAAELSKVAENIHNYHIESVKAILDVLRSQHKG